MTGLLLGTGLRAIALGGALSVSRRTLSADVLLVTGPVTSRMLEPLRVAYAAMPEPHRVAALGDCSLGCNVLGAADAIAGPLDTILPRRPAHSRLPTGAGRDRACPVGPHRPGPTWSGHWFERVAPRE